MLDKDFNEPLIKSSLIELIRDSEDNELITFLEKCKLKSDFFTYNNWNGGTNYYNIILTIPMSDYKAFRTKVEGYTKKLKNYFLDLMMGISDEEINDIIVSPEIRFYMNWEKISISKKELLEKIHRIKAIMVAVSTGKQKIEDIDSEYKKIYREIDKVLNDMNYPNPNFYKELWEWYGKWSSGEYPTYQLRRNYLNELFDELIQTVEQSQEKESIMVKEKITGWERVDRTVKEIKKRLREATVEEQYQAVGLLSRELIISLGQAVYDYEIHGTLDGVRPSNTDAKRMLEAFIESNMNGSSNQAIRKYAKSTLELANDLTHRRTATNKEASLCTLAVITLTNIIKMVHEWEE